MTGLNHDWDRPYGPGHADFQHGAVDEDDFDKEVVYTPRRRKKGCKKHKGNPCAFTKKIFRNQWWSSSKEMWVVSSIMTCEKCGKHDWTSYKYEYRKSPVT